ncbi:MAG: hypothetical protein WCK67_07370 [bacterium]
MGLAASQGRMLTLTGRKSDIEYRGQIVNNERTMLSYQQEALATAFNEGLNNRILEIKNMDGNSIPLTVANLATVNLVPYYALDDSTVPATLASDKLEASLRNSTVYLKYKNPPTENDKDKKVDWITDPNCAIQDRLKTEDDAAASSKYEALTAELQSKDKRLELDLKNIDTQHTEVQTEIDAVKKVIDKNIDMTFKTFG